MEVFVDQTGHGSLLTLAEVPCRGCPLTLMAAGISLSRVRFSSESAREPAPWFRLWTVYVCGPMTNSASRSEPSAGCANLSMQLPPKSAQKLVGFSPPAGRPVPLTDIEHRLLVELAVHVGRVLSYAQLLQRVWARRTPAAPEPPAPSSRTFSRSFATTPPSPPASSTSRASATRCPRARKPAIPTHCLFPGGAGRFDPRPTRTSVCCGSNTTWPVREVSAVEEVGPEVLSDQSMGPVAKPDQHRGSWGHGEVRPTNRLYRDLPAVHWSFITHRPQRSGGQSFEDRALFWTRCQHLPAICWAAGTTWEESSPALQGWLCASKTLPTRCTASD